MATSSSLLSCYILLNLFFFLPLLEENFLVSARELVREHHVIDVKSLLPRNSSSMPDKSPNPSKFKVVHQYGKFHVDQDKSFHVELIRRDQARVDYIHHRTTHATGHLTSVEGSLFTKTPTYFGLPLGALFYYITIGLGTQKKFFNLVLDTGSDLTWTQCIPCVNCYPQKNTFYDPNKSSTSSNISCNSNYCKDLKHFGCSSTNTCLYHFGYFDGSYTKGSFIQDTLAFFIDDIHKFRFGCGQNNHGKFGILDGMLGLGQGDVSIISQTAQRYNKVFSYCLPSWYDKNGYLGLGMPAPNVQYTPMIKNIQFPSWYFLTSTIFTDPGTILDSGVVVSRLPPIAYSVLRENFRKFMRTKNYPTAPPIEVLDTCYNFSNYKDVDVPLIALIYDDEVTTNLNFNGIFYSTSRSQACLAFLPNNDDSEFVIIGNVQQRTFNVVYDVGNLKIGFGAMGCK